MHDLDLIVTLTIGFSAALILGYLTQRLRLSPILGYLIAGIVVGPYTPGPVANSAIATQLAEVGVILLMFGVGLHFHLKDLIAVKRIALPGALVQSAVATTLGMIVALLAGWGPGGGLLLGLAISVASTVVLLRVLMDNDALETPQGHIAVGWLIVEDLFTVLIIVLLPVTASFFRGGGGNASGVLASAGLAVVKLGVLAFLILVVGSRVIPWLLTHVARTRSRELFTLSVLAIALVVATGSSYLFGASMALGAFLAGMVVGQSKLSNQAAADALPMRDAFAVLFFVSVGMLFDPRFILAQPFLFIAVMLIILVAKPLSAMLIVLFLGYSFRSALTVAIGLAQIGEFSFILATAGAKEGVLPAAAQSVLVASALLSIALNPLLFRGSARIETWLRSKTRLWELLNRRAERRGKEANTETVVRRLADDPRIRAVVVGYGPVGQTVTRILEGFGIHVVIVDLNVDTITRLVGQGKSAIYGDAGKSAILRSAGVEQAKYLVVTLPDLGARIPVFAAANELNPGLKIFSRARYLTERDTLEQLGVSAVCYEEAEAAVALSELLLRAEGSEDLRIAAETDKIRGEFALRRSS